MEIYHEIVTEHRVEYTFDLAAISVQGWHEFTYRWYYILCDLEGTKSVFCHSREDFVRLLTHWTKDGFQFTESVKGEPQ